MNAAVTATNVRRLPPCDFGRFGNTDMAKLFVAIDLPDATARELARLQPAPQSGIRRADPSQMHLTLHFLGEADVDRMAAALQSATVPAFRVSIEAVGQFSSRDGAITLWAGARKSADLLGLHSSVADALSG
jgi:2'-5' RNA ligase